MVRLEGEGGVHYLQSTVFPGVYGTFVDRVLFSHVIAQCECDFCKLPWGAEDDASHTTPSVILYYLHNPIISRCF